MGCVTGVRKTERPLCLGKQGEDAGRKACALVSRDCSASHALNGDERHESQATFCKQCSAFSGLYGHFVADFAVGQVPTLHF